MIGVYAVCILGSTLGGAPSDFGGANLRIHNISNPWSLPGSFLQLTRGYRSVTRTTVWSTPRRHSTSLLPFKMHVKSSSLCLPIPMIAMNLVPRCRGFGMDTYEQGCDVGLHGPLASISPSTLSRSGGRFFQFFSVPQKVVIELVDGTGLGGLPSTDIKGEPMTKLCNNKKTKSTSQIVPSALCPDVFESSVRLIVRAYPNDLKCDHVPVNCNDSSALHQFHQLLTPLHSQPKFSRTRG